MSVNNAYARGGIPLSVTGVANVKIASQSPTLNNAIERFLGKSRKEIIKIAKETLEGNLRGVFVSAHTRTGQRRQDLFRTANDA